jgi:DNA-binding CsgD family transcriptional regulator
MDDQIEETNLRMLAREASREAYGENACTSVWQELAGGRLQIYDVFTTELRSYLLLGPSRVAREPLSGRNLMLLEQVLLGACRKTISSDVGISLSTLGQILKQQLVSLGVTCAPSRVPPLLVLLVHAAYGLASPSADLGKFHADGATYVVLSSALESGALLSLPPAERAVLQLRLHGSTYSDIASLRRTSYRTVANQIAAACHRLGVSGRLDLLHLIATSLGPQSLVVTQT